MIRLFVLVSDYAGCLWVRICGCRGDAVEAWVREDARCACNRLGLVLFHAEFDGCTVILDICVEL